MPHSDVTIVRACVRDGAGGESGSPTAVLREAPLSDERRRRVPVAAGTSHAVFVSVAEGRSGIPAVSLRFFTAEGELPACGHGTLAALACATVSAGSAGSAGSGTHRVELRTAGRVFEGRCVREGGRVRASFEAGAVSLREPTAAERDLVVPALGVPAGALGPGLRVASTGRPRLLVPVRSPAVLAGLAPDSGRLRAACDRLGLLGCYVHSGPTPAGRRAARMFAPSIGVPEDIANANSTGCLAAHLADGGADGDGRHGGGDGGSGGGADGDGGHGVELAVDMGDSLGSPSTITASARPGPSGPVVWLGGAVEVADVVRLSW
ncbi:PhzF family phenazine biosynthesis protein [Streptomyces sp. LMG1-1-1.1]|uniref:PhzF family phenazine biosynthesis protein n=1 Tax=Streptomyces sp. LMG1-1-1.1 TaxID=3135245 RepID=UPI0034652F2C